jgi:hypothetical protein
MIGVMVRLRAVSDRRHDVVGGQMRVQDVHRGHLREPAIASRYAVTADAVDRLRRVRIARSADVFRQGEVRLPGDVQHVPLLAERVGLNQEKESVRPPGSFRISHRRPPSAPITLPARLAGFVY